MYQHILQNRNKNTRLDGIHCMHSNKQLMWLKLLLNKTEADSYLFLSLRICKAMVFRSSFCMSGLVYLLVLHPNHRSSSGSFNALKKSNCIKLLSFSSPSLSEYPDEQENESSQQSSLNTACSQPFLPCRKKTAFDQHPMVFGSVIVSL